ncbi:hypothetical protein BO70DRAFT_365747 [Aspergillus heteromorphus CBS 117.55]|uniref:Uncharacterized protein n=1 Tax=Aspergillus heteromorphus CBS 117.55 TaxID=1448321 RepID=A0A317V5B2_9EURO|nr:uncharacterized protein BO70DRAFT_365747 [Aspergillus heteromorphus CBS 117.55]PWY69494.1 hypothetical protein BO70DRAFT_365747 [Aspergillus heteromorphus CBS 117.55]
MAHDFMPKAKAFTRIVQRTSSNEPSSTNSLSNGKSDSRHNHGLQRQMWTPAVLQTVSLAGFAVLFAAMLIVIAVLYWLSNRNEGLSTSESKYHYLWTYGPTAVLTIVAGCWGQVEYRTKQLMPWKSMSTTPKPAPQSLLLDYISDWNVLVMFRALKQSDWAAALAILGTLLIKLLTVVSTGLFMLQAVQMDKIPTVLEAQAIFNGTMYNGSMVDATAAMTVAGTRWLGLPHPVGTTEKYAFQPFTTSNTPLGFDAVISGTVDLFSPDLQCDVGTVTNWTQGCGTEMCEYTRLNITLSTSSCSKYHFTSFQKSSSSAGGYYAEVFSTTCADTSNGSNNTPLIFTAAHWTDNSTRIQALVCTPTYTVSQGLVSLLYGNQSTVTVNPTANITSNNAILNVSPNELGAGLISTLAAAEDTLDTLNYVDTSVGSFQTYQYNLSDPNSSYPTAFYLVANLSSPHALSDLLDASVLKAVSLPTYTAMTAQIARRYLMSSSNIKFKGTYSAHIQRLIVREFSVRVMEATLAALIILIAGLWTWRPVRCTPRDPSTIAGMASILSRSPSVSGRLVGCQGATDLVNELADGQYHSKASEDDGWRTFSIEATNKATEGTRTRVSSGPITWWQPMSASLWWWVISIVLPILIIAGLETAYQISRHQNGLGNIDSEGYIRYTWVYLPALVMLVTRVFFDCIHFSAMLFQPYLELRQGGITTPGSLMENHLSKMTPFSFCTAIARRQWAVCATATSVLLAPVLTVAVSGLYSTEDVTYMRPASIARIDSFNSSISPHSSTDSNPGIGLTGALVVAANLSYPPWTYGELVIPTLSEDSLADSNGLVQLQSLANGSSDNPDSLQLTVPALRASLTCEALAENIVYSVEAPEEDYDVWQLRMNLGNKSSNDSLITLSVETDYPGEEITRFGVLSYLKGTLAFGDYPTFIGFYGTLNGNSTNGFRGFTCNPRIDEVDANGSFILPGLQIGSLSANDSSARLFTDNVTSDLSFSNYLPQPINQDNQAFDAFFSAMIDDQKTLTMEDITDLAHYPTVINATQHLYRVLMAQSINGNSRIPSSTNSTRYSGTLMNPNGLRLVQSAISTRILEGCLAAMILSTLVAYRFMRTKEVIPVNPCSIAGTAMLLAGSDMLKSDVLPPGSEWWDDKELMRRGTFSGLVFGLGWWEGSRFGIDIGKPEAYRD